METRSGSGSSYGVNYSYALHTNRLFGQYECRVHRYFLDSGVTTEVLTDPFTIAESQWQLKVQNMDGHIGIYLHSLNEESVAACCKYELVNPSDPSKSRFRRDRHLFKPRSMWGIERFVPTSSVGDPDDGYCRDGCFIVHLSIGVILPENEVLALTSLGKPFIFTWQIRHLKELDNVGARSEEMTMANTTWFLELIPWTSESNSKEEVGAARLHCTSGCPKDAKFRFTMVNHHGEEKNRTETRHKAKKQPPFVWSIPIQTKQLHEPKHGFIEDGWLTFSIHIFISNSVALQPSRERSHLQTAHGLETPQQPLLKSETEGKCVVCLVNDQTSGFIHGDSSHKCVCVDCCKLLRISNARCPVCGEKVDSFIMNYY